MRTIDKSSIARPEVEGGVIFNGVRLGPEVLESFRELEVRERQAISGEPYPSGVWQGDNEAAKAQMKAIVAAAGFPNLLD